MGEISWGGSSAQMQQPGQSSFFNFSGAGGMSSGSGLVSLLEAVKDTAVGNEMSPAHEALLTEFSDSVEKFGNYVHPTDKRLNGLAAWSLPTDPNVGVAYTFDTADAATLGKTMKSAVGGCIGEVVRRQNRQEAIIDIMAAWFIDLRNKLTRTVIAQDANGLPVLALTGGLTQPPRKNAEIVNP